MEIKVIGGALYQWDKGRQVEVIPDDGMEVTEVHFANANSDTAYVMETTTANSSIVADIPDIVLQKKQNIVAYLVIRENNEERTVGSKVLKVNPRAKPNDYVGGGISGTLITYNLKMDGTQIILLGSDGSKSSVSLPLAEEVSV